MSRSVSALSCLALALALLLAGGCGEKVRVARPLEIAALPSELHLRVSGDVELAECSHRLRLSRDVAVRRTETGAWTMRPSYVQVRGLAVPRLPDVAPPALGARGALTVEDMHWFTGFEGPAQAARSARLGASWAAARWAGEVLWCGYPLPEGRVLLPRPKAHARAVDPWPDAELDDPAHFLLAAPPDLDLLAVLPLIAGSWSTDERKEVTFTVRTSDGGREAEARAFLKRSGGTAEFVPLVFGITYRGELPGPAKRGFERETEGQLTADPQGGIRLGSLKTRIRLDDAYGEPGFRATFDVHFQRKDAPGRAPETLADARLGHLLGRKLTDRAAYYSACLAESAALARARLLHLRPDADLDGVQLTVATESAMAGLEARGHSLIVGSSVGLASEARTTWLENAALIFGLPYYTAAEVPHQEEPYPTESVSEDLAPLATGGWALDTPPTILIAPGSVADLALVAHEYAHIAALRFRYEDTALLGLGASPGDYAWVDVDGMTAASALHEAQAEACGWAASLGLEYSGEVARLLEWWGANLPPSPPLDDPVARLHRLAYRVSPVLLQRRHRPGDVLEDVVARTWRHFSYQTREILFADTETKRTVLWPRARELQSKGAKGASRIGAWGVWQLLECWLHHEREIQLAIVHGLEDDVLVKGEKGALWLARWSDAESARAYATRHASWVGEDRVEVEGTYVAVTSGEVPDATAWIAHLTAER